MIIIGIAGGSGSGKTTVVKRIAKALPPHCAAIIPLDSYYNDTTDLTPEERKQINFDHPDAFDWKLLTEQIKKLRNAIPMCFLIVCQKRFILSRSLLSSWRAS